jgi:hypothetical protein
MSEELHANIPTGNGESMQLRLGGKAIGLQTKDLVSVLMVVLLGVFGYFMADNMTKGQERGFVGLAQILDKLNTNQLALLELVHTNRSQLLEELGRQNQQVAAQTAALRQAFDEQSREIRRLFITLNYNFSHEPDERLPLEFLPSEVKPLR